MPIRYADDVDVARDGTVYLSDATTKFDPTKYGGSFLTSRMDLMEHGGHGRLIEYAYLHTGRGWCQRSQFANGVTMTNDRRSYRGDWQLSGTSVVSGYALDAATGGRRPVSGFPDNVTRGRDGRYWVSLVSQGVEYWIC